MYLRLADPCDDVLLLLVRNNRLHRDHRSTDLNHRSKRSPQVSLRIAVDVTSGGSRALWSLKWHAHLSRQRRHQGRIQSTKDSTREVKRSI